MKNIPPVPLYTDIDAMFDKEDAFSWAQCYFTGMEGVTIVIRNKILHFTRFRENNIFE